MKGSYNFKEFYAEKYGDTKRTGYTSEIKERIFKFDSQKYFSIH